MKLKVLSLNIRHNLPRFPWIEPSNSPIITLSRPNSNPNMLVRDLHIHQLSVTIPSQSSLRTHSTITQSAIGSPFLNNVSDELDFLSEIVGLRNSLDHGIDFRALPGSGFT